MIIAVVGSGGKTTLVKKYAKEYLAQGKKVFVTTSTHMYIEEDTLLTDDAEVLIRELEEKGYLMAGGAHGTKMMELPRETYEKVCQHADVVLIEADGSRHLPIKFPREGEPVIYDNVDEIVVVCGLHALGKPAKEVAHRLELVKACLGIEDETIIQPEHIQKLVEKGYVESLQKAYPEKTIRIKASHDDSLYQRAVAKMIEDRVDVSLLKKEWFMTQPELFVCGAGHVATELVKMASLLDFKVRVMDDREEFANAERLPMADEVICDTFDNLEQYLGENSYNVILTRGHASDYICVKTMLQHSYQYLGMIGSSRKYQTTVENLRKEGFSWTQIGTIHSPIGLPIQAKTPAEIAVSILAEIIQEKNKKNTSFASREILGVKEEGVLCIIIEKHGSAPRGVGSMMFVNEHMTIDSVGGGAVERAAIQDGKNLHHVMIQQYNLNQDEIVNLGMICGGSNKILFIPI